MRVIPFLVVLFFMPLFVSAALFENMGQQTAEQFVAAKVTKAFPDEVAKKTPPEFDAWIAAVVKHAEFFFAKAWDEEHNRRYENNVARSLLKLTPNVIDWWALHGTKPRYDLDTTCDALALLDENNVRLLCYYRVDIGDLDSKAAQTFVQIVQTLDQEELNARLVPIKMYVQSKSEHFKSDEKKNLIFLDAPLLSLQKLNSFLQLDHRQLEAFFAASVRSGKILNLPHLVKPFTPEQITELAKHNLIDDDVWARDKLKHIVRFKEHILLVLACAHFIGVFETYILDSIYEKVKDLDPQEVYAKLIFIEPYKNIFFFGDKGCSRDMLCALLETNEQTLQAIAEGNFIGPLRETRRVESLAQKSAVSIKLIADTGLFVAQANQKKRSPSESILHELCRHPNDEIAEYCRIITALKPATFDLIIDKTNAAYDEIFSQIEKIYSTGFFVFTDVDALRTIFNAFSNIHFYDLEAHAKKMKAHEASLANIDSEALKAVIITNLYDWKEPKIAAFMNSHCASQFPDAEALRILIRALATLTVPKIESFGNFASTCTHLFPDESTYVDQANILVSVMNWEPEQIKALVDSKLACNILTSEHRILLIENLKNIIPARFLSLSKELSGLDEELFPRSASDIDRVILISACVRLPDGHLALIVRAHILHDESTIDARRQLLTACKALSAHHLEALADADLIEPTMSTKDRLLYIKGAALQDIKQIYFLALTKLTTEHTMRKILQDQQSQQLE